MDDQDKEIKTKEVDPGWNDPPVFSYESHQAHARQSKGIALNKRVIFPMTPNTGTSTPPINVEKNADTSSSPSGTLSTPPTGKFIVGTPPKNLNKSITSNCKQVADEDSDLQIVIPDLDVILKNFNEALQQAYNQEEKESNEIKRRLCIMEKMWNEDKFNSIIKKNIYKLSLAIKEDRYDDSDNLQRTLMVDHSNVCSTWMAGIRKLLYRKKEVSKL